MKAFITHRRMQEIMLAAFIALLSPSALQSAVKDTIVLNEKDSSEFYIGSKSGTGDALGLFVGESTVLDGKGVRKVYVSNPDVAKVHVVTVKGRNYMVLTAKKEGYCDLVRIGRSGPLEKVSLTVRQSAVDTEALGAEIRRILPESTVGVHNESYGLVVTGRVENKEEMDTLLQLLTSYSRKIDNRVEIGEAKQIKLEAKIIEMSRTKLKEAGINLLGIGSSATAGIFTAGSLSSYSAGRGSFTDIEAISPFSDAFQLLLGIGDISTVLSILENRGITKTLSSPSIITEDKKAAKLFVGGSIPIPVPQTGTNVVTIEWKDYGIKLDFVPNVTKKGAIALNVQAEAGDLSPNKGVMIGGTRVPAIDTRRVDSEVTLKEGEDLVIAGLMFSKDQNTIDSVPVLGDIPVIGTFFQKAYDSREELELIVVLQPHFVSAERDDTAYKGMLTPLKPMQWSDYLMGSAHDRIE
jgi:pilus assembly protein CpaC